MRHLAAAFLAVALPAPSMVRAEAPAAFATLRDRARPLESLGVFLDRYVGACDDPITRGICQSNARKTRSEMEGKTYYLILDEEQSSMVRPRAYDPARREFRLDLTPIFVSGGLALSDGAPSGLDPAGRPRIGLQQLSSKLPDDWMPMDLERLFRTRMVKVHVVFKPLGVWSFSYGGKKIEGVRARFLAVRLTNARTGDEVAMRIAGER